MITPIRSATLEMSRRERASQLELSRPTLSTGVKVARFVVSTGAENRELMRTRERNGSALRLSDSFDSRALIRSLAGRLVER